MAIRENMHLRFEATFTNVLNHTNYAPPATNVSSPSTFGVLDAQQTAENAGNQSGQVALRFDFYKGELTMRQVFNSVRRRSVVFKGWTMFLVSLAVAALFAIVGTTIAAQTEATPNAQDNVAVGEAEVKQMLPLMHEDKDGKVSKQDFMKFMEAEFDRLDKNKEGRLDIKKLTQPPAQPVRGFHK
jgi:hypothetical protein